MARTSPRRFTRSALVALLLTVAAIIASQATTGDDKALSQVAQRETQGPNWPHFLGPNYDNISPETGLLKKWPPGGPKMLWTYNECGVGYSAVTVVKDTLYSAGDFGDDCMVFALDLNGKLKWKSKNGQAWQSPVAGSRSTPTYSDGRVFHLNAFGYLTAYDAKSGKELWNVHLYNKYGLAVNPEFRYSQFGYAESPVVVDNKVIVFAGGDNGFVVALDVKTGKPVWECPNPFGRSDHVSYCTPSLVTIGGVKQLLYLSLRHFFSIDVTRGKILWGVVHFPKPRHLNVLTEAPKYHNGYFFITAPYTEGAKGYKVNGNNAPTELWLNKNVDNEHGGTVLIDNYVYTCGQYDYPTTHGWIKKDVVRGIFYCLDLRTGKEMWSKNFNELGWGQTTAAEGLIYFRQELGTVNLIEATPKGPHVISTFNIPGVRADRPSLNMSVIAGKRLYIRDHETLYCHDIAR